MPIRHLTPTEDAKLQAVFPHPPAGESAQKYESLREGALEFARLIMHHSPEGSERSTAIQHVCDALTAANAAVALKGLNL
jgi:hypothetical protein